MRDILFTAIDAAVSSGAEYADARWCEKNRQTVSTRDKIVVSMQNTREDGVGIRVFYKGAWGFAGGRITSESEAAMLGRKALEVAKASAAINKTPLTLTPVQPATETWRAPMEQDPFSVPAREKVDLLLELNGIMKSSANLTETFSFMDFLKYHKLFASSIGSFIDQTQIWSMMGMTARVANAERFASRSYEPGPRGVGYELITGENLPEHARRIARQAMENLNAKPVRWDSMDLILLPSHTRLVIHETIGHATELDRVMGWEADYAGTSFATPEKLNMFRYGSSIFNVTADRTQPNGLATCKFDDEGVPTQKWKIIENGILTGYATTRDSAPLIGLESSQGCAFADNWNSFPILRMANVGIDPGGDDAPSLDALIADTKLGILVDETDSFSIDHQRINFQFGGDYCRLIRNGKLEDVLWNVVYEGSNPSFWNSVDAICNADEWRQDGIWGCAKGQPVQIAALTHASAPLRLKNIKLVRS